MPTTWYLEIADQQPPFDSGVLDLQQRALWTFNIMATKVPSDTFQMELVALLVGSGLGTYNGNIFNSSKAVIPTGPGPYLNIVATGGTTGLRTQNKTNGPTYERASAQITVRAISAAAAEAMCRAAYAVLVSVRNTAVPTAA
jgi:hypothetical protein